MNNAGVVHNFAETIASAYEESDVSTKSFIKNEWLEKANEAIDLAINLDSTYAKYYCTKGRLLAIEEKYDEAKESIRRAIDIEDSGKIDYVIRLGNYQYYLLLVQNNQYNKLIDDQMIENQKTMNKTVEDIDNKLKETNIKNLEFLGFFAAIVSFTIGSIQIINNQTFESAMNLIIVLFAALLSVFSAFGFMLNGLKKNSIPNVIVFVIGVTLICVFKFFL
jgi:tetratricopeptide (TPR) repeat protein